MLLLNRSPGMFIVLANLVVFGVIGAEVFMWTAASTIAVVGTLLLIAFIAGVICLSAVNLISDASGAPETAAQAPARAAAPVYMTSFAVSAPDAPVAARASAPARRTRHTVAHV